MRTLLFVAGFLCTFPVVASNQFVSDRNVFSGEAALNLSPSVPLSVSTSGKVTTGITTLTIASTSSTTTTSATSGLLSAMTLTPGAGTYWVQFNTSAQSTTGGNSITMGIYANGSLQGETITIQFPTATLIDSGYPFFIGLHYPTVTVAAGQAITIEWSTNGGTATCLNRRLSIMRVQ